MSLVLKKLTTEYFAAFKRLWQFYEYNNSSFSGEDLDSEGKFDIDEEYLFDIVREYENCEANLLYFNDTLCGFVMVEPTVIDRIEMPELADIFILPKYRGKGLSYIVLRQLMFRSPETWHIAVCQQDRKAFDFWKHAFAKLPFKSVRQIDPPETEGFYEFIVETNIINDLSKLKLA
ncbi:GNAT family N-acetyltransferase [Zooshikella sp. RANM57]|uniref:GNAT family N-acetyltransferase n=1 Tax=Zooshikella sp. RANM57 TaxID=3425863 RepID=UPI003D701EB8